MGINAMIHFRPRQPITESLDRLSWELVEATGDSYGAVRDVGGGFYELGGRDRWYSPSYARGPWPQIYGLIRWTQVRFPGCEVFYFADHSDRPEQPTTEADIAALWEAWATRGHQDYRGYSDKHQHCGGAMSQGWGGGGLQQLKCIRCDAEITVNHAGEIVTGKEWPKGF